MNFDEMSDYKVNRKLAWLIHGEDKVIYKNPKTPSSILMHGMQGDLDYCNSWADMGPLIEEHAISLEPLFSGGWYAGIIKTYSFDEAPLEFAHDTCNKNPLRAAAICLIKKLEAEND